jgi:hypothetical protein
MKAKYKYVDGRASDYCEVANDYIAKSDEVVFEVVGEWKDIEEFHSSEYKRRRDLGKLVMERNRRLKECDWTQLKDATLSNDLVKQWSAYRQQLRDFPETVDIKNPIWPTEPA